MISTLKKYFPFLKMFHLYLSRHFLKRFLIISLGSLGLVYIITFVETIRRLKGDDDDSFFNLAYLTFAQIPPVIDKLFPFLILLSTLWSLFSLLKGSEITVLKAAGISILKIAKIYCTISCLLSAIYIFCLMPLLVNYHKDYRLWQFKASSYHENVTQKIYSSEGKIVIVKIDEYHPATHKANHISLSYLDKNNLITQFYYAPLGYYDMHSQKLDFPNIYFLDVGKNTMSFSKKLKNFKISLVIETQEKQDNANQQYDDIYGYYDKIQSQKQKNLSPHLYRVLFYNLLIFPIMCSIYSFIACVSLPSILRGKTAFLNIMIAITISLVFYLADGWFMSLTTNRSIPLLLALVTAKITVVSLCFFYIFDKEYGFSKK